MSKRYKSKQFQKLYDSFVTAFQQEGDVYQSLLESINSDYQHKMIPGELEKSLIISVLNEAAIDYYSSEIEVLSENNFLNKLEEKCVEIEN